MLLRIEDVMEPLYAILNSASGAATPNIHTLIAILAIFGGLAYLFWRLMQPKDLVSEITRIKTQNQQLYGKVKAVAEGIAGPPAIPKGASSNQTTRDQVTAKRREVSHRIDEGADNIVATSERARQTTFTTYPPLSGMREDLRRALLRDLELIALWERVQLQRLYGHALNIRERVGQPGNSEEQILQLLGTGEQALYLLGVIWHRQRSG